jgi:hypothetical protein
VAPVAPIGPSRSGLALGSRRSGGAPGSDGTPQADDEFVEPDPGFPPPALCSGEDGPDIGAVRHADHARRRVGQGQGSGGYRRTEKYGEGAGPGEQGPIAEMSEFHQFFLSSADSPVARGFG